MAVELLGSSAFGAALVVGFRHGFDWDHLAALSDLTGSQSTARRSMWLATLYALGHACMVLVLGAIAIVFAEQVPPAVDAAMGRVAGATLVALGAWIAWSAVRTRGAPPLRSRWMLVLDGLTRLLDRRRRREVVVIEHTHPHDHRTPVHDHAHLGAGTVIAPAPGADGPTTTAIAHSHAHRHVAVAPRDPFLAYGGWSSFGVGALHGVGAETPTQVLVLVAAAQARTELSSFALLACFVVGLVVANTVVAAATTLGFRSVVRHRFTSLALAAVAATFSLVLGSVLLVRG